MYYLFKDIVAEFSQHALIGKSHTFKDLFFRGGSYQEMLANANVLVEKKDHDFAIGIRLSVDFKCLGQQTSQSETWDLPTVAIECKTYLDKTMLQDAATAAEQLKYRNPSALYIVVAEWLKLAENVNLKKFKIDQIYVLRKQKNTDREFRYDGQYLKNPIYDDTVIHLFKFVRAFLTEPWEGGINHGLARGYLI
jgi:Bpu10I restriction endonuclease